MKIADVKLFDNLTDVYYFNRFSKAKITIDQGGTYSGKTYSTIQNIIDFALENNNSVSTITAFTYNKLEEDSLRHFKRIIQDDKIARWFIDPSLVRGPYRLVNGSMIEFRVYDSVGKARGPKRELLYISEANMVPWDIADQLITRTEMKVYIDYNPVNEFWVHDELLHRDNVELIISNYTHNKFITKEKIQEIEGYYLRYLETKSDYDLNKWRVYGLGQTGIVEGMVIPHVRRISQFPDPYYLKNNAHVYGLDFGFTHDPTAICKVGIRNGNNETGEGRIVGKQMFYRTGVNSFDLPDLFPALGITKKDTIVADRANGEAIDLLNRKGYNVLKADKGPGSVKSGIELINKHGIDITVDSEEWFIEQKNYEYRKTLGRYDKNMPLDKFNHLWDGCRYAANFLLYGIGAERQQVRRRQRTAIAR